MVAAILTLSLAAIAATIAIERGILRTRAVRQASDAAYLRGIRDTVRHTGPKHPAPGRGLSALLGNPRP